MWLWFKTRCTTHFSRDFSGDWDVHSGITGVYICAMRLKMSISGATLRRFRLDGTRILCAKPLEEGQSSFGERRDLEELQFCWVEQRACVFVYMFIIYIYIYTIIYIYIYMFILYIWWLCKSRILSRTWCHFKVDGQKCKTTSPRAMFEHSLTAGTASSGMPLTSVSTAGRASPPRSASPAAPVAGAPVAAAPAGPAGPAGPAAPRTPSPEVKAERALKPFP